MNAAWARPPRPRGRYSYIIASVQYRTSVAYDTWYVVRAKRCGRDATDAAPAALHHRAASGCWMDRRALASKSHAGGGAMSLHSSGSSLFKQRCSTGSSAQGRRCSSGDAGGVEQRRPIMRGETPTAEPVSGDGCQHTAVEPSETQRSAPDGGESGCSQQCWVLFDEACQPGWGGGVEEAVPRQGPLDGPAGIPSASLQRRCPGLRAAWMPARRPQLLHALASLQKPSAATTVIGKLLCPDHPAVRNRPSSQAEAYGLFTGKTGIRGGELVGWYGGELVLESEVRLDGSYAASFTAIDRAELPRADSIQAAEVCPDVLRIDAARLRTKMAFINDFHWDALGHGCSTTAPSWWPETPNVELRQVVLRLEHGSRRARCRCGSRPPVNDGQTGAWWPLMGVYALEDIAPDTELFLDYSDDYWGRMRALSEVRRPARLPADAHVHLRRSYCVALCPLVRFRIAITPFCC